MGNIRRQLHLLRGAFAVCPVHRNVNLFAIYVNACRIWAIGNFPATGKIGIASCHNGFGVGIFAAGKNVIGFLIGEVSEFFNFLLGQI
ncbi:MAG: hypothetical protein ACXWT3_12375 [Methylococcaceae bacterium]